MSMFLCGVMSAVAATGRQIPGGATVEPECILQLENNAVYRADAAKPCSQGSGVAAPQIQIYASDVHWDSGSDPITSFTADWVVPPLPADHGVFSRQVVYFWPGFKAKEPEMGYPVLQPVLQYGERGPRWELQSWFVDARNPNYPVVTAPPIMVSPGDKITSFMRLSEDKQTWTVSGAASSGGNSTLHIAYDDAGDTDYNFAMLVNENVNVNTKCALMPASRNVTFTNVVVNGNPKTPWTTRENCAENPECNCQNKATVNSITGDVTLAWNPQA